MSDRLRLAVAIVLGIVGLVMLARLDVPVIEHGGFGGGLTALDLIVPTLLLSAAFGLGMAYRPSALKDGHDSDGNPPP